MDEPNSGSEKTPLEELEEAIIRFANRSHTCCNDPILVRHAVVVFETQILTDEGLPAFMIDQAKTMSTSPAAQIGLLRYALTEVTSELIGLWNPSPND